MILKNHRIITILFLCLFNQQMLAASSAEKLSHYFTLNLYMYGKLKNDRNNENKRAFLMLKKSRHIDPLIELWSKSKKEYWHKVKKETSNQNKHLDIFRLKLEHQFAHQFPAEDIWAAVRENLSFKDAIRYKNLKSHCHRSTDTTFQSLCALFIQSVDKDFRKNPNLEHEDVHAPSLPENGQSHQIQEQICEEQIQEQISEEQIQEQRNKEQIQEQRNKEQTQDLGENLQQNKEKRILPNDGDSGKYFLVGVGAAITLGLGAYLLSLICGAR